MDPHPELPSPAWTVLPFTGTEALSRHESDWRQVLAQAPTERVFLEPEWVLPWLGHYARRVRGLFMSSDSQPRAAMLLVAERLLPLGRGPRLLRPPGFGVGDYLDLLLPADRKLAAQSVQLLFDWLLANAGWDLLDLPNLPAESPTASLVSDEAARRGLAQVRVNTHRRPYLALEGSWEQYLASRPSKLRYNLRARQRQLASKGELRIRHYQRPTDLRPQLTRAAELHARRWAGQRTSTTFSSSPVAQRFYLEAAERLAKSGLLDLGTLELDDAMVAFCLGFVYGEKLYYYLPGFDPDYARYAPSTLLLAHLIESAYGQGLRELDFMLGEEPYKQQWSTGVRSTQRLVVAAPGPPGAAALAVFRAYLLARERARRSPLAQRLRRHGLSELRTMLRLPFARRSAS
jgi:CelD/BcsL family acetyltransferase involved in cellulose biosynthesis